MDIINKDLIHVSGHSLKATSLSWSAKYGLGWSDRAILGRHQSHTNEATAIYSRDLSSGPVSRFSEVVAAIHNGQFCPDAPRSKYFPFPPLPTEGVVQHAAEETVDVVSAAAESNESCKEEPVAVEVQQEVLQVDSDSESSDSESSTGDMSTSESEMEQDQKRPRKAALVKAPSHGTWVAHKKSGLLHCCWKDPSGSDPLRRMTACGRTVTDNFVAMSRKTDGNVICVICQRRQ